jgi:L-threonylcarbamoyladenylate synthase
MSATPADIDAAAAALRAGELVAFPTETVYGLGADARNPDALRQVYALKGRPATHPLILHLLSAADLDAWAAEVPPAARRLAARFWPGPLTLVLRRAAGVSDVLTGGQDTLAVRVPAHPVARALLQAFGSGIAAPSANRYGRVSPTRAAHVREEFPHGLRVLDGGDCEVGLESTILSLAGPQPQLLRPGTISREALEAELGVSLQAGDAGTSPRVPGSTPQHYAPQTPLSLLPVGGLPAAVSAAAARGEPVVTLACPPGSDAAAYGRALYAELRRLDKQGASRILVESVPASGDWDAVRDRLARAAATFL